MESERQRKIAGIRSRNVTREEERVQGEVLYAMLGLGGRGPVARENVNKHEAKVIAHEHDLKGFILFPYEENEGGIRAYVRDGDGFRFTETREVVFTCGLLDPGLSDGSEYGAQER